MRDGFPTVHPIVGSRSRVRSSSAFGIHRQFRYYTIGTGLLLYTCLFFSPTRYPSHPLPSHSIPFTQNPKHLPHHLLPCPEGSPFIHSFTSPSSRSTLPADAIASIPARVRLEAADTNLPVHRGPPHHLPPSHSLWLRSLAACHEDACSALRPAHLIYSTWPLV